jgi:hypothetical protein
MGSRFARLVVVLGTLMVLGVSTMASAFTTELPAPTPFNSATQGAFTVFSLPIIVLQNGGIVVDGQTQQSVQSSPGQIQNELVLYTGVGGKSVPGNLGDNNSNIQICGSKVNNCVDNPFPAPSGATATTFGTNQAADPSPTFTGDRSNAVDPNTGLSGNTWDITLAALDTFLTGDNVPIFFFNHNQDNAGTEQDLFGWGQIIISDIQGVLPDLCFNLNNNTTQGATACGEPQAFTARDATDPSNPSVGGTQGDFVFAAGQVCLDGAGNQQACDGTQALGPVNHNLGADSFAYAIVSFGLNDFLASCFANLALCGYDVMRADFRLRELTNGFEQLIMSQGTIDTPLPATLTLIGLGAAGLGLLARRRRARAAA